MDNIVSTRSLSLITASPPKLKLPTRYVYLPFLGGSTYIHLNLDTRPTSAPDALMEGLTCRKGYSNISHRRVWVSFTVIGNLVVVHLNRSLHGNRRLHLIRLQRPWLRRLGMHHRKLRRASAPAPAPARARARVRARVPRVRVGVRRVVVQQQRQGHWPRRQQAL